MTTNQPDPHTPAECHFCGQRATGVGIGFAHSRDKDPKWLCAPCSLLLEDFRKIKRMDAYEEKALGLVDEDAANYCADIGKTDMAEMDELERRMLWKTVWSGSANHLRALVREGTPF